MLGLIVNGWQRIATTIPNCPDVTRAPYGISFALGGLWHNKTTCFGDRNTPILEPETVTS